MTNRIAQHSMSLWRHFFHREETEEQLTASMIAWQEKWNWDFMKINPAASYHVLDWGARYTFFDDEFREPLLQSAAIQVAEDIDGLKSPDPGSGHFGDQLRVIGRLRSRFGSKFPIIQTVFSPIEVAHRMMNGRPFLLRLRHNHADRLHKLLEMISAMYTRYAGECLDAGADGIFFATKWASSELLSWAEYEEFGKNYEAPILETLREKKALIVLHVCGERTHLRNMLDYPVDAFSYDFFAQGAPDPRSVTDGSGGKLVIGGIDPDLLEKDVDGVLQQCAGFADIPNWVAGPSCVVPPTVPEANIARLKDGLVNLLQ